MVLAVGKPLDLHNWTGVTVAELKRVGQHQVGGNETNSSAGAQTNLPTNSEQAR
jgi:hypothetical protein